MRVVALVITARCSRDTPECVRRGCGAQTVEWIGKRIDGLTAAVELQSCTGEKMVQTMATNSGATVAVVLPVIQTEVCASRRSNLPSLVPCVQWCGVCRAGVYCSMVCLVKDQAEVLVG